MKEPDQGAAKNESPEDGNSATESVSKSQNAPVKASNQNSSLKYDEHISQSNVLNFI